MATSETQQLDEVIVNSRRKMLALGGAALAGLAFAGVKLAEAQTSATYTDSDILNFALNLEYLESQFYTLATAGMTINQLGLGIGTGTSATGGGTVVTKPGGPAGCLVSWTIPAIQAYATETAKEERNHVSFLRGALGSSAVAQPNLDLFNSFNTLAGAAGIATTFDPFANDLNFLIGAYIFEDVGVTAYSGAAPLITTPANLAAAAGILAVEAYHAGLVRTSIFGADPTGTVGLQGYTQKISATRMALDGSPTVDDIGVGFQSVSVEATGSTLGAATIVDAQTASPNYSRTYSRTTTQVLQIVTGNATVLPTGTKYTGVFFPAGLNGLFS
ncbi:Dessication-associated protein (plasmid) [Acidisarcina polymorpha]|uniref:Dessication-associated protein n=1 Tax=Acidisarcina polymorpha TaxID=2211140 RepID=A0A2Z5GAC4_9BACT|nr:ferritin-like domain-containing protein [Acidisarcina polymorpha]AXC16202.1 Dessication-associated protein [Acidisarcina polymorpha]